MTVAQIGDVLGVSRTTIYRTLNRHSVPATPRRPRPAVSMLTEAGGRWRVLRLHVEDTMPLAALARDTGIGLRT